MGRNLLLAGRALVKLIPAPLLVVLIGVSINELFNINAKQNVMVWAHGKYSFGKFFSGEFLHFSVS
jgi:hypothetical protein